MSDSNTILPTAQINGLEQGLDAELAVLEGALQSQVYLENLPIIGTQLGAAFQQGQAALRKFSVLEANVKQALTNLNNLPNRTLGNLQSAINGAVNNAGFANTVLTTLDSGSLTLKFNNSANAVFNETLGSNFGLPGLNFATSGSAQTTVGYNLALNATVDTSGNFSLSTPSAAPALSLTLGVKAPTFTASALLGSSDATLGFLKFNAADKGSNLNGTFGIDTSGNAEFTGSANLDVGLGSNMGSAALPSVSAELVGSWSFGNSPVAVNNQATFGDAPSISLKNVSYDFGTFVNKFIEPILNEIAPILQPIEKALAVFDTPLDFLGGGTIDNGNDGLLGTLWHQLDVAGAVDASGNDMHDDKITLVDLLKLATGANLAPMVNFLNTVTDIAQWATALSGSSVGSAMTYNLGSFSISNDIRAANFDISQIAPIITGAQDLPTFLAGLSNPPATPGAPLTPTQALQALLNPAVSSQLSFPIISNPTSALQFLLGGTADLFDANFLVTPISFGSIDPATGNPTSLVNLVPPINLSPIPLVNFDLTLQAALQATVGLNFGYDTSGLTAFKNGNFADPSKILNGLFVEDPIQNGVTEPVAQISGAVQLGVEASALIASIGGGGNIGGSLSLSFSQPGKNYLNVLANKISNQGALSIFDASGRVTAGFQAVVKALGASLWTYNSPRIELASFDTGAGKAGSGIPNATTWVGPVGGDFETKANWNPTFATINGTVYYGDATIGQNTTATFAGQLPADLASLALGTGSTVNLTKGKFTLDGTSVDSVNSGTVAVNGAANLIVSGSVKNAGAITAGFATGPGGVLAPVITADGLMQLYGGGHVILSDATTNHWLDTGTNPLLWNLDNTISGAGTINLPMLNQGVMNADGTKLLVLTGGAITNQGLLEATGKGVGAARTGGLSILSTVQNGGGTIAAHSNGDVIFQNGITINGGTLQTSSPADGSIITTAGQVTLDGGATGLTIAGNVAAGTGSTLTLTGLIKSQPYSTTLGQSAVSSGKGTVLLQGATIKDGELNAITAGGSIKVSGTATLDGSDGAGSLALDGILHVSSGNTLVVAGSVNPGKDGGGIELTAGTLLAGNATADAAALAPSLAGSIAGTGGSLLLDDVAGNVVTGADAGSLLTNSWTIRGSGQLGNGQLAILNTTKGVIEATGGNALVLHGGGPVINAGLIEAGQIGGIGGTLDLQSSVANAGGTIAADGGTTYLDGAAAALTIGGGALATSNGGAIMAMGNVALDGTAGKVTIASAAVVTAGSGATITLKGAVTNNGFLTAIAGGALDLQGTLANANGAISTLGGAARLDGVTLSGGALVNAPGDHFEVVADSVLDGSVSAVTLVPGALVVVDAGRALTLKGSIVDHGTIGLTGNSGAASIATLKMAGLVALSGGGTIALADASGSSNAQLITGAAAGVTLDNVHVAISGYGKVGAGDTKLVLKNESGGVVNATSGGGSLIINTGANAITNAGLLEASAGGVLDVHSNVANAGGTIAGNGGTVELDVVTVSGGTITTTAGGTVDVLGSATLNGVVAAVTIAAKAQLSVGGKDTLTLKGTIVDAGVLSVTGTSSASVNAELLVSGTVALTGGGTVSLQDANGTSQNTQIVTGTASSDLLDNVFGTISGYGRLGAGLMTLKNEAAGTINAMFGTLAVYTGVNSIVNAGLLEATTAVLDLKSNVNNVGTKSTIGAVAGGTTQLDQITVTGGSFTSATGGKIAVVNTATLDGTTNTITLTNSALLDVGGGSTLTLKGSIVDQGLLSVFGNGASAAKLLVSGAVALSGTGTVALSNIAGPVSFASETITSIATGGTLDHLGGTISGYGEIVGAKLALINEKGATVEAAGGNLVISTGTAVSNLGLLEAVGGNLLLQSPVTNGGTILAGAAGVVSVQTTITNTGLVFALNSGIVLVQGNITGATGTVTTAAGGMIELDHGTLNGGTLNNAAKGTVEVTTNGGTLANISVVNSGVVTLVGNSSLSQTSALHILGSVELTGSDLVSLSDSSGLGLASSQVITGAVAGDTLDNFDNTISGYGLIGNGLMTLENETSATIDAVGGTIIVDTGTTAVVNTGLLEAATSSVLDLRSDITNTGGTIDANGGAVDLDGISVIGGTLTTENGGTIHVTGSAALAGIAGPVTLTLASHLEVDNGQTLTLEGMIVNQGTLNLVGNGGGFTNNVPNSAAFLDVSGTATLSGGGTLSLFDGSGYGLAVTEVTTGTVAGDTLDNFDNTISGYGRFGNGLMILENDAGGTINAAGGTLTVDTGTNTITNKGLLEATTGVLQLNSGVANVGGTISAQSNVVDLNGITVSGGVLQTSGANTIQVIGAAALDGTTAVTLASGAQLVISGGDKLTLNGSITNHGTISLAGNGGAFLNKTPNSISTLRVSGAVTLSGGGLVSLSDASGYGQAVSQVVTGTVAGDTLENVDDTIRGYGQLGNGLMILENDAGGTINATGGTLVVDTGKNTVVNNHLIEATAGGLLDLRSNVSNSGATIAAVAAPVLLDGMTVSGGTLSSSVGGSFQVIGTATLVGTTTGVTLALGTQLVVASGDTLTLKGSIANQGTVGVIGSGAGFSNKVPNSTATLRVGGTVALSGSGTVSLFDGTGYGLSQPQVITGTLASDTLDNIDNTISGYGLLGNGLMTLKNEAKGTIEATGGTLTVDTAKNSIVNVGLLEVVSGALIVKSAVTNSGTIATGSGGSVDLNVAVANTGVVSAAAGGTITLRAALSGVTSITNVAAASTLVLDGGVLQGGTVSNAAKGSINVTTNGGTLKTIAVVNAGVLSVIGNGAGFNNKVPNSVATLHVGGVVTLSGGGTVSLFDGSGYGLPVTEVVTGAVAGDTLDNIDNTISGYGQIGNGLMTLKNEANGTINATGGILTVDTGKNSVVNKHLIEATAGGVLDLRSNVSNAAATITAVGAVVKLDGMTVSGGSLSSTSGGAIQVIGTATLAGTATAVTLATGTQLAVASGDTLVVNGSIINRGTVGIAGSGAGIINKLPNSVATLRVGGAVTLSGGGTVSLLDASGFGLSSSQVIIGTVASDKLDNIDNTISGFGLLGNGLMTLKNEAKGTIDATGGTLTVDTAKNSIVNIGLLEGVGGVLQVKSAVTNSGTISTGAGGSVELNAAVANTGVVSAAAGGTITLRTALSGATSITNVAAASTLVLDGGVLQGGTASNAATGSINVTTNGAALQTIAVANAGTLRVIGNGAGFTNKIPNSVATLHVGGTVTLSGGGTVSLFDGSGFGLPVTQVITGTVAGDTLDNVDNTISGYGQLGNGLMTLKNEAKGTIDATGGTLTVDTAKNSIANIGLLEGVSGALQVQSAVTNSGTIATGAGGSVELNAAVANTGLVSAAAGGTITLRAFLSGATSITKIAAASTLVLDGGVLQSGTVSNAATGSINVTTNGGALQTITVANAGTLRVIGNGAGFTNKVPNSVATLHLGGVVTLSGGGTVSLFDGAGFGLAVTEVITGTVAGDTLDNIDNTISGYGQLGNGLMTLKNEAKGTINATGGILTVDTGTNSVVNKHLIEATAGGVLDLRSNVSNAAATITAVGAVVKLDGMTVSGGALSSTVGGAIQVIGTATLAGTATAVALATGTQLAIASGDTLVVNGSVINQGTVSIAGSGAGFSNKLPNSVATLRVGGVVMLSGGGTVSLSDASGFGLSPSQVITGTVAGDTLDNIDNTISGFGLLGNGLMTLKNEAKGTINATSGTLTVDTGKNSIVNKHLLEATSGVLDLRSNVSNAGGTITATGATVQLDGMIVSGGILGSSAGGAIQVIGTATLDGTAAAVTLTSGAQLAIGDGNTLILKGSITDQGAITDAGTLVNNNALSGSITISGAGQFSNLAGAKVTGAVTATAPGETIANLGTVTGAVTLAGGDRLITGAGAVFTGGIKDNGGNNTLEIAKGPYALTKFDAAGTAQFTTLQIDAGVKVTTDATDIFTGVAVNNLGTLNAVAFKVTNTLLNSGVINGNVGLSSGATLNNLAGGTISGSGLAAIAGTNGPATVLNAGLIDPGTFGVNLPNGGSVTNLAGGVIEGASAGVKISGGAGIVTNAGTISGGGVDSVILASGFINRVVVDPGAKFIGVVDGGNKAGSGADSTLEFAAGAGGSKLSGLGTAFINFATLSIDSGALISLQGGNTIAAISNAGTLDAAFGTETLIAALITAPSGSSGVLEIDASGDLVVNAGSVDATQSVMFTDGTGTLTIGTLSGFAATIGNAATGDEIIVQGKSIASTSFNAASHALTLLNASKGVIGTLTLVPSVLGSGFKADGTGGITLVDPIAPGAPSVPDLLAPSDSGVSATDNITSLTTPAFTGTAEANSKVTLFDGVTAVGSGNASVTGAWSITSSALAQGAHSITAKAADLSGNTGVVSAALHVTIDTTAPAAPGKPDLAAASDSGGSNTDNITKVTTPVFTGTAEANATLALFDGVTAVGSGKASAAGVWSITSVALGEGAHAITAKATDQAGNVGVASSALSVTIDSGGPAAPSTPDLVATSDIGVSSTDDITKVTTPVFGGTAEPNSAITLFNGAIVAGAAKADAAGHWSITSSALAQGIHAMTAKAIDPAGNTGPASAVLSVTIDTTAPAAPSAPDLAAASDSGACNTDNITDVTTPLFTGAAAANALVTLFDGATAVGSGNASAAGAWSITSSVLAAGTHSVTATAADTAGNLSAASKALSITINPSAPVSASTIGLPSSPNFMAVPGSEWAGTLAGHWGFGDIAADLNAATAQLFSGGGVMDTASTGAGVMTATDWAGTATGDYTAAHFWGGNDSHVVWPAPFVGH